MQKRLMCSRVVTTQRRRANAQNKMHNSRRKREREKEKGRTKKNLGMDCAYYWGFPSIIRYKAHRTNFVVLPRPGKKGFLRTESVAVHVHLVFPCQVVCLLYKDSEALTASKKRGAEFLAFLPIESWSTLSYLFYLCCSNYVFRVGKEHSRPSLK